MPLTLRYGANPHQGNAVASMSNGSLPIAVLNGQPSYINLLDALTAWQVVLEVETSTGLAAAASFKHVTPAGVAVCLESDTSLADRCLSPATIAYMKARACDAVASFGDAVAVSTIVDVTLANYLKTVVSDLIIAPGFDEEALSLLCTKKKGRFVVIEIDKTFEPPAIETKEIFGVAIAQDRNRTAYHRDEHREALEHAGFEPRLAESMSLNAALANITLKCTVSNSMALATEGQVIGISAAQQSRIGSTRLACDKADKWMFAQSKPVRDLSCRQGVKAFEHANAVDVLSRWGTASESEKRSASSCFDEPLTETLYKRAKEAASATRHDLVLCSDGFIPFSDNIDRAVQSGVVCVVHPGGSTQDENVAAAARDKNMTVLTNGKRAFYH